MNVIEALLALAEGKIVKNTYSGKIYRTDENGCFLGMDGKPIGYDCVRIFSRSDLRLDKFKVITKEEADEAIEDNLNCDGNKWEDEEW